MRRAALLLCPARGPVRIRRTASVVRSDGGGRHPLAAAALVGVDGLGGLGGSCAGCAGGAEDPAAAAAVEQGQGVERRSDVAGFQPEGELGLKSEV